jgi:hypothetical protein
VRFSEPVRVPPPWVDPEGRAVVAAHQGDRARP